MLVLIAIAIATLGGGVQALAATSAPTTRWSVVPADGAGPDGRRSIEAEMDAGQSRGDFLALRNLSNEEITFRLAAADGFFTSTGRFDTLTKDKTSTGLGAWITLSPDTSVAAGSTSVVPFRIDVPATAEPGDYSAGITASVVNVQSAQDGTSIGVESRIGFRVSVLVRGDLNPSISITAVTSVYDQNWSPIRPGSATIDITVTNNGNTRLAAKGTVTVGEQIATFPAEGQSTQELLPGDTRTIVVNLEEIWPLIALPAHVSVAPQVLSRAENPPPIEAVSHDMLLWAIPLPQIGVFVGLALVVVALTWERRRSRRKVAKLIEQARQEGRRESVQKTQEPTAGPPEL